MADGRKNNGAVKGISQGQGRKPKADEIALIDNMDKVAVPSSIWQLLYDKCMDGDTQAIKAWLQYRYGMPKQVTDITTLGESLNTPAINFTKR